MKPVRTISLLLVIVGAVYLQACESSFSPEQLKKEPYEKSAKEVLPSIPESIDSLKNAQTKQIPFPYVNSVYPIILLLSHNSETADLDLGPKEEKELYDEIDFPKTNYLWNIVKNDFSSVQNHDMHPYPTLLQGSSGVGSRADDKVTAGLDFYEEVDSDEFRKRFAPLSFIFNSIMAPQIRVRILISSVPEGANIFWKNNSYGATDKTLIIVPSQLSNLNIIKLGWKPCNAADALVRGWHNYDNQIGLLVKCTLIPLTRGP